ncbi:hypothetical protein G9F72_024130 [Clostridium estertheticum]|uniref:hypothetical protein n=1 Tax=Clostridium estertheticum TaxID=238834 RepID=UPI0013E95080|nr:hypothetical protein [Clostridium estertheticum]MBZ9689390.1 hypothetical protein [Clostridium estertheticum]
MCKIITINVVKIEHHSNIPDRYNVKVYSSGKFDKVIGENKTYDEALEIKCEWDDFLSK